ncbi:NTP transferase domain-containing protein [Microbacterium sp. KR10-403]|uniref:molybdenum cofactor guanylyltransferase n=1 Tax=Microbacterium sp. KR10-403 TaxID=3158581 RepID=UPI0032E3B513
MTDQKTYGAVLLAGGRASRMGGVDKPRLVVDGVSMLDRAITAMREVGAAPIVVAGPAEAPVTGVEWVREDPPFTGPAAAVVAALAATAAAPAPDPDWTFVLACDLPRVDAAVRQLVADILLLPSDTEGACLSDETGRPQWLTGVYRTSALRRAAASLPDEGRDQSMRALFADVAIATLEDRADGAHDIDTWEDFRRFTKEDE